MNRVQRHLLQHVLLFILLAGNTIGQQAKPGFIEGTVVGLETDEPISGVTVALKPLSAPESYVVQSTGNGRFQFRNIPPGQYTLSATRAGYVRSEYGKRRTTDPEVALTVESSQTIVAVKIRMIQAAAMDGHAVDSRGEPVPAAVVRAFENAYVDGRRALRIVQTVTTDDLGNFRLFSLLPGRYYVSVGIPSGSAPAPTFYPDTSDVRNAGAIDLSAGATAGGITIHVLTQPLRHIRGMVDPGNADNNYASVELAPRIPILNASPIAVGVDRVSGTFDIPGTAPGAYLLIARGNGLFTQTAIEVGNTDINGIEIPLPVPIDIPVHVAIDPAVSGPDRIHVSEISFGLRMDQSKPMEPMVGFVSIAPGALVETIDFMMRVLPGDYRIVAQSIPANAYIQSIRLGNHDVLNDGLHVDAGFNGHLEIIIGSNPGTLEGIVMTSRQQPLPNAIVVLVPDASHRQRLELFKSIRTDSSGRFEIKNIPPGDYSVFSWEDVEPTAWMNPEFMGAYDEKGQTIQIAPGIRKSITVAAIAVP